jgi:hypothetical protein
MVGAIKEFGFRIPIVAQSDEGKAKQAIGEGLRSHMTSTRAFLYPASVTLLPVASRDSHEFQNRLQGVLEELA